MNKKAMKIRCILIITLVLSFVLSLSSFATDFPEPTSDFFVNDFANVIDDESEEELMAIGASLYKQTTAQVVVVTVDSLDGYEVGEYALELGREWGIGSDETDNGVVLLMSVNDREVTIQVGYGLEGCLPDGKTGRILDTYAIPYLSNNDFSLGLAEAYKAIVSVVCDEYGVELNDYNLDDYNNDEIILDDGYFMVILIVFSLVLLFVFIVSKFNGNGGSHHGGGTYYGRPVYRGGSHYSGRSSFRGGGGSFGGGGSSRGF